MKRPLVYFSISIFIGCLSASIMFNNSLIGAVFSASFLCIIIIGERKQSIFLIVCFILGIFNFYTYFNINVPQNAQVRIINKYKYSYLASYKGRKVFILGNLNGVNLGRKIKIEGEFKNKYEFQNGTLGTIKLKNYKLLNEDVLYKIIHYKDYAYNEFKKCLGKEKTSIVMSLCFGETRYISNSDKDTLKKLGVIHAVSVSGFHMALIYKLVEKMVCFPYSILISLFYIIFTGMKPSAIRAFIMIIILKMSKVVFRNYDSLSSISLAAIIILISKPYYIFNIGFMLSFLSTLGIILYNNKISKALYKLPSKINKSIGLALSSQIFTFPYMCFTLKEFSLGFLIGNICLVPLYAPIVLLGNIALVFIKIPIIFKLLNNVLFVILNCIQGAHYILNIISPNTISTGYIYGVYFVLVYMSYIFYKAKYEWAKIMPIYFALGLIPFMYTVFFTVYFFESQNVNGILIKHRTKSTMICSYNHKCIKDVIKLKKEYNPSKIITNPNKNMNLKLGKYKIKIMPCDHKQFLKYNFYVEYGKSRYFVINHKCHKNYDNNNYDIIKIMPKTNQLYKKSYWLIKGNIYPCD